MRGGEGGRQSGALGGLVRRFCWPTRLLLRETGFRCSLSFVAASPRPIEKGPEPQSCFQPPPSRSAPSQALLIAGPSLSQAMSNSFQTEIEFELPRGYLAPDGTLHRKGLMRMATARDEILAQEDPRVLRNEAYTIVILLSRTVTKLGTVDTITTAVIESVYAIDYAYLQDTYTRLNRSGMNAISVTCPQCGHQFVSEIT